MALHTTCHICSEIGELLKRMTVRGECNTTIGVRHSADVTVFNVCQCSMYVFPYCHFLEATIV